MNIVFMGTPEFAVQTLEKIIDAGHNVQAVVTKEDKPKGRGHKIEFSPVKIIAIERDLNILQPKSVKDKQFANTIKLLNPDVIVVVAYGKILTKEILEIPRLGCINVHASLLPQYRGAAPIHAAILNGDSISGVTTMFMDEGMDTGDILLKTEVPVLYTDTTGDLHDKLCKLGAELLIKTLNGIVDGSIERIKQNDEEATYTKIIDKTMGLVNWNKKSDDIINFIRALNPWPSAYTFYNEKMMKIWEAVKLNEKYNKHKNGEIVSIDGEGFVVKTADGSIKILKLQMQNSKMMKTSDFMRGHNIKPGEILDIK